MFLTLDIATRSLSQSNKEDGTPMIAIKRRLSALVKRSLFLEPSRGMYALHDIVREYVISHFDIGGASLKELQREFVSQLVSTKSEWTAVVVEDTVQKGLELDW